MSTESVQDKAARLLAEGRVGPHEGCRSFTVEGDSATYVVVVGPDVAFCSCPATTSGCSHLIAARRWLAAEHGARVSLADPAAASEFAEYVRLRWERIDAEGVAR